MDENERWQQRLFELMANKAVRLTVEGEMGNVDAQLSIFDGAVRRDREPVEVAQVIAADTFEDAMRELLVHVIEFRADTNAKDDKHS